MDFENKIKTMKVLKNIIADPSYDLTSFSGKKKEDRKKLITKNSFILFKYII